MAAVNTKTYLVTVNIAHVQAYDEELMNELLLNPHDTVEQLEEAVRHVARTVLGAIPSSNSNGAEMTLLRDPLSNIQVQLTAHGSQSTMLRTLDSAHISKFVRIPGIIVSTSSIVARPVKACVRCRSCGTQTTISLKSSFGGVQLPPQCPGPQGSARAGTSDVPQARCPRDSFYILPEQSSCVDQQSMKLQEAQDAVPVGELPRHVLLVVDRSLVNRVTAGSRVIINGVYSIMGGASKNSKAGNAPAIRTPFVRVLGIETDDQGVAHSGGRHRTSNFWTEEEESEMIAFSQQPDLYNRFAMSIAPPIFGCDDIKRALTSLLFGGSKRVLPDGIRLRGDINVLLLGDPGTAKSQFLKFIERVAPIAVYTSGKGSSAAGLTASVIRDPASGDFYLEGGAMVLADGGVVCIDEFDKMDEEDRVAIHEAMEQQTISIAKAGITTVLNSRSSVLAAANPVFGRYDEMRTPGENIDFSTTILSRFDMIFLVKDEHNLERDQVIFFANLLVGTGSACTVCPSECKHHRGKR
jgi:DNA replication licensing factor MCM5